MTEAEWLACKDPDAMLAHLGTQMSDRKARLFAISCCRRISKEWGHPVYTASAMKIAELFCEHNSVIEEMDYAQAALHTRLISYYPDQHIAVPEYWVCSREIGRDVRWAAFHAAQTAARVIVPFLGGDEPDDKFEAVCAEERRYQCRLLGYIFANPFRPVAFSPAWRTDTAMSLAQGMYDSRDFSAMPILADALQDAGCDSDDILSHCRGEGPHVRGCWAVDLMLGKA